MSISFADRPGTIRIEGQEITLKFDRTSPECGTLSWNIPPPANGCDADTRAYNGIVITGSLVASTRSSAPVDGNYYSADPTMDANLFAGDTIGAAHVVGSFYNDVTTTTLTVCGLDPTKPYYFSAYAVNNVANYHQAGVHAYSTSLEGERSKPGTPAFQGLEFSQLDLDNLGAATGLSPSLNYSFELTIGCNKYTVYVPGNEALSYSDLTVALNKAVDKILNPPVSEQPPNTGALYLNNGSLYQWNGYSYTLISTVLESTEQPDDPTIGTYWYNTDSRNLWQFTTNGWCSVSYIRFSSDPTNPTVGMYLFNGTTVYRFNGVGWCEVQTFLGEDNPFIPDTPLGMYWYHTDDFRMVTLTEAGWKDSDPIYSDVDPNSIPDGYFWFSTSTSKLREREDGEWTNRPVIIAEDGALALDNADDGSLWYSPSQQSLYQKVSGAWETRDVISHGSDPSVRSSCADVWWRSTDDELFSWDQLNQQWVAVIKFGMQNWDPTSGVVVDPDAVWVSPDGTLIRIDGPCGTTTDYIYWGGGDPRDSIPVGTVWYDTSRDMWFERGVDEWVEFIPIRYPADPHSLPSGMLWLNDGTLMQWNGISWTTIAYSTVSHVPQRGALWMDNDGQLYEWDGTTWAESEGLVNVGWYIKGLKGCSTCTKRNDLYREEGLYFTTTAVGSDACIEIKDINLFKSLPHRYRLTDAVPGGDGVVDLPPYMQEGVGTDGTDDDRRVMIRAIELALGGEVMDLEIGKESFDHSIDRAIQELRYRASPYTRGYYPIAIEHHAQKRLYLTNKRLGHNRIIDVLGAYRATGLWPSSTGSGVNNITQPWLYGMLNGLPQGSMLSHHLLASYMKELDVILARRVTYFFDERTRVLEVHNVLGRNETLLLDCAVEMTEQDLMSDRRYRAWIERWAIAEARVKLAEVRGKYQTIPTAGGGTSLNGAELEARAQAEFAQLLLEVDEYVVQDLSEFPGSFLAIG